MKHKWHKEIKAWADGAEIEVRFSNRKEHFDGWNLMVADCWNDDEFEFRIKPQPKEPQYINVYGWIENGNITFKQYGPYIGKIKLEVDDADQA